MKAKHMQIQKCEESTITLTASVNVSSVENTTFKYLFPVKKKNEIETTN